MKKVLGVVASFSNILVSSLPFPWWYTNIGGIIEILDSPFFIGFKFMGIDYTNTLIFPINLLLLGLRVYIILLNSINIYLILAKNKNDISLFIFWLFILYTIDPLIILLISLIIFNHPVFALGSYTINYTTSGYEIEILLENYPLLPYYLAGFSGVLSVIYKIISRSRH
ncbi:MAG: hypothetical protein QXV69_03340 [Sulfolobaceae archaeon]